MSDHPVEDGSNPVAANEDVKLDVEDGAGAESPAARQEPPSEPPSEGGQPSAEGGEDCENTDPGGAPEPDAPDDGAQDAQHPGVDSDNPSEDDSQQSGGENNVPAATRRAAAAAPEAAGAAMSSPGEGGAGAGAAQGGAGVGAKAGKDGERPGPSAEAKTEAVMDAAGAGLESLAGKGVEGVPPSNGAEDDHAEEPTSAPSRQPGSAGYFGSMFGFLSRVRGQGAVAAGPGHDAAAGDPGEGAPTPTTAAAAEVATAAAAARRDAAADAAPHGVVTDAGSGRGQRTAPPGAAAGGAGVGAGAGSADGGAGAGIGQQPAPAQTPRSTGHYAAFVEALKDPDAKDVARALMQFIREFRAGTVEGLARRREEERRQAYAEEAAAVSRSRGLPVAGAQDVAARVGAIAVGGRYAGSGNGAGAATVASRAVLAFRSHLDRVMATHPVWAGHSTAARAQTQEAVEKFLMLKLHPSAFGAMEEESAADDNLARRVKALSFVRHRHLDIQEQGAEHAGTWAFAQRELGKLNAYRTPRDKLVCVLNCCRVLSGLLASTRPADSPPGADDLLPALIYCVLRGSVPRLHTNLNYIAQFRHPSQLVSEPGYYFTLLVSAVAFVEAADARSFSMPDADFRRCVVAAAAQHGVDPGVVLGPGGDTADRLPPPDHPPAPVDEPADVPAHTPAMGDGKAGIGSASVGSGAGSDAGAGAGAGTGTGVGAGAEGAGTIVPLVPALEAQTELALEAWRARRYRFVHATATDLRVGELGPLLREYKNLAATCERLLADRGVPPAPAGLGAP